MTSRDNEAADQLDRYLDRLTRDAAPSPDGLDPRLAAAARALRAHEEAVAPDPQFVARLREILLMDATIPVNHHPSYPAGNGVAPTRATSLPTPLSPADTRHRDARPRLAGPLGRPVSPPVAIDSRRNRNVVRRWNRHAWPVVELIGAAVLIVGLVSVMVGGNGGGGLPALLPGFSQTSQEATPVPGIDGDAVAMAQGNAGRTGEMPGPGVTGNPAVRWQLPLDTPGEDTYAPLPPGANPGIVAVDGLMVYVERESRQVRYDQPPVADVTLHAVDPVTGNDIWKTTYSGISQGQPLIADGLVVVTVDPAGASLTPNGGTPVPAAPEDMTRGHVVAFDAATGLERWRSVVGLVGYQSPAYAEGLVFVSDRDGNTHGLDSQTGAVRWSAPNVPPSGFDYLYGPFEPITSSVAVADGMVVVSSYSGFTYAFTRDTGAAAWSWPAEVGNGVNDYGSGFQSRTISPVISGETVFLTGNRNNGQTVFAAVDLRTGQERWTRDVASSEPITLAVVDDIAVTVVGDYNARVLQAVDVATGMTILWEVPIDNLVRTFPTIADGIVYHGGPDGTVRAIDLATGTVLWQVRAGGAIATSVYAVGGAVFFASQDDWLYAVDGSGAPTDDSTAAVDISGLPPCAVEPRPDVRATPIPDGTTDLPALTLPDATPALTLAGIDTGDEQIYPPVISWDEIPLGVSVTGQQAQGIAATLQRMQACDRPGNGRYLAAFYTDDYFLRPWVVWQTAYNGYSFPEGVSGRLNQTEILAIARVLPDGRVAVVQAFEESPNFGSLIVFAEQGGEWLIDETAEITPDGIPGRG